MTNSEQFSKQPEQQNEEILSFEDEVDTVITEIMDLLTILDWTENRELIELREKMDQATEYSVFQDLYSQYVTVAENLVDTYTAQQSITFGRLSLILLGAGRCLIAGETELYYEDISDAIQIVSSIFAASDPIRKKLLESLDALIY